MRDYRLFIDRLPLWRGTGAGGQEAYDVVLPLRVTRHDSKGAAAGEQALWAFDSCYTGDALTSPEFLDRQYRLIAAGPGTIKDPRRRDDYLDPNGSIRLSADCFGQRAGIPIYRARLWLCSNLPEFAGQPFRIDLASGIAAQPGRTRNILGRGAFLGTGLQVRIDFDLAEPSVSVWVPLAAPPEV